MSAVFFKAEFLALLALWVPALLGLLAYGFQKKFDLRNQLQELRRKEYVAYFTSIAEKLHYQTIKAADRNVQDEYDRRHVDALGNMRRAYYTIVTVASDNVCRKISAFQNEITADDETRDLKKVSITLAELIHAVRNEGYGRSRLTQDELVALVNSKI